MIILLDMPPPKATSQTAGKRVRVVKGKPVFFKSQEAKAIEQEYLLKLKRWRPQEPLIGPLQLSVTFRFPFLKGDTKKERENGYIWHDTKPDLDNMSKMLIDCMAELGFFNNDSQICVSTLKKKRAENVGIYIELDCIEGDL